MKLIKVAGAVLNQTPLDWDGNLMRICGAIAAAREQDVSVLALPEMCITGYGCEDAFHSPGLIERAMSTLVHELLPETEGMVVSFGLPIRYRNGIFNSAGLAVDGNLLGFVPKRFLAGEGLHYEPRWFKPWPEGFRSTVDVSVDAFGAGSEVPIGDIHFEVGGVKLGFEICEDAWVPRRPGGELAHRGVDIILNPSASHFAFGKHQVRRRFALEGSRAFSCTYVHCNLLGNEAGRAIYDGGVMVCFCGDLVAAGPRFTYDDFHVTAAVVDVEESRMRLARTASFIPEFDRDEDVCVEVPFAYPTRVPVGAPVFATGAWEEGPRAKEEEFTRAIGLALFDYMRKSRSRGFVVSLSGGADSSACAALVALALERALAELGPRRLTAKLPYLGLHRATTTRDSLVGSLLTCVYQATRNSSDVTRDAARAVAAALGATFHELDVDGLVTDYVSMIAEAIGRELSWETDDLTLQNIQARARAPGVWMLANLRGALLVATSNRSEAAVGYATMDGDTCGGISPIAGIDKAFLRRWLRWMEAEGPEGVGPLPALAAVNAQAPTAELRPKAAGQTDEDDLMPYEVLDAIERAAIRDKKVPLECYQLLAARFPDVAPEPLATWVERFFTLWCRNQWKRERYAPSFHVDDENLDPKTWCRFPILSGGFKRELAEMRAHVAAEERA